MSPEIACLARTHSEAMASGRVGFGHRGFDERAATIAETIPYSAAAENTSRHERDPATVPAAALTAWLASDGHRKNLEGDYDLTGVGAARSRDGTLYLTQIFVRRR